MEVRDQDAQRAESPNAAAAVEPASVETVDVGPATRVIVLRGAILDEAEDALRAELIEAIEGAARVILLDLSRVESLTPTAHALVAAASVTLADRGGSLLAWSEKHADGSPAYLIADVRDRGIGELIGSGNQSSGDLDRSSR